MSQWPASMTSDERDGTHYVSPAVLMNSMERYGYSGQGFKFRTRWTSYLPDQSIAFRNAQMLKFENEQDFFNVMASCFAAGMNPPSSFTEPFKFFFRSPMLKTSVLAPFRGSVFGGWQHVFGKTPMIYPSEVYWYDLTSAYRWSSLRGLPNPETAYPLEKFDLMRPSIYIVDGKANQLPYWYRSGARVVTNEELLMMKTLPPFMRGVAFADTMIDLSKTFKQIDEKFPHCRKRVGRAFWGIWNSMHGPKRITWKNGRKESPLPNPIYNPVWAAFVTSRIKLRVMSLKTRVLHVYVDAVLTTDPIETGEQIGDWRLLGKFKSVWIRWPGNWGCQYEVIRHSGQSLPIPKRSHAQDFHGTAIYDSRPWIEGQL